MDIEYSTYKDRIIHEYADKKYKSMAQKVIRKLRKYTNISEPVFYNQDDTLCENYWNALCVRVYEGETYEPYDSYALLIFEDLIKSEPEYIKSAMWCDVLEKDCSCFAEDDLIYEEQDGYEELIDIKGFPYSIDEIFKHLWDWYILKIARNYSNKVIRNELSSRGYY